MLFRLLALLLLLMMQPHVVNSTADLHMDVLRCRYSAQISALQSNGTVLRHSAAVGHRVDNKASTQQGKQESAPFFRNTNHNDASGIHCIDLESRTVLAFQHCSMEELFDACVSQNLLPKVVVELKGVTVGGAIAGAGIESSSFRYGQFNDICQAVYVLCGDGQIRRCSRTENADLWAALAGSYGNYPHTHTPS
jgi:hypothetical protein